MRMRTKSETFIPTGKSQNCLVHSIEARNISSPNRFQRSAFLLVELVELGNLEDSFEEDEDEIGNLLPIGKVSK